MTAGTVATPAQAEAEQPNYAARWGQFVAATGFEDLPADVVHRMKRSLLDMLGVGIIGSRFEATRVLLAYIKRAGGTGEATVFPDGVRTSSFHAALANGSHVHAPELAESFTRATMHCGNAVPPAALAEAEKLEASGRELITAMAVGYEIAIRAGLSVRIQPNSLTFAAKDENRPTGPLGPNSIAHPVSTFGLYGATAGAAKILKLDAERAAQSLILSTSLTPAIGRGQAFWEGASAKDIYQGLHNAVGVLSAELAAAGMTGGADVIGHLKSLVADFEPSWLDYRLGNEWLISSGGLHFKLHLTSGMTQPAADALLDAMSKRRIAPEEIERIDVLVPERANRQSAVQHPPSVTACTISIPYVLSALVTYYDEVAKDPHFTELYTQAKYHDPRRDQLAGKVFAQGDDALTHGFEQEWPMRFGSHVEVKLKSGEVVTGDAEIWSISANLSDEQVMDKFRDIAGRVLPRDQVERAIEKVFTIDGNTTVEELVRSCCL
jgi:2-methylcitrate dehydratase PrpD